MLVLAPQAGQQSGYMALEVSLPIPMAIYRAVKALAGCIYAVNRDKARFRVRFSWKLTRQLFVGDHKEAEQ